MSLFTPCKSPPRSFPHCIGFGPPERWAASDESVSKRWRHVDVFWLKEDVVLYCVHHARMETCRLLSKGSNTHAEGIGPRSASATALHVFLESLI